MTWGRINSLEPPYKIEIHGLRSTPDSVREHVDLVKQAIAKARAEYHRLRNADIDVSIETDA